METALRRYGKSVRIPGSTPEEGSACRVEIDQRISKGIAALAGLYGNLVISEQRDERGRLQTTITTPEFQISVAARYGRDTVFRNGVSEAFLSYNVEASAVLKSAEKAQSIGADVTWFLRIGGAIGGAVLLFGGFYFLLRMMHFVVIPHVLVAISVVAGASAGAKLGAFIGNAMENHALARAEDSGAMEKLEKTWDAMELALNSALAGFTPV